MKNADLLSRVQNVQQQLQSSEREKQTIRQQLTKEGDELDILWKEAQRSQQVRICGVCCDYRGPLVTAGVRVDAG